MSSAIILPLILLFRGCLLIIQIFSDNDLIYAHLCIDANKLNESSKVVRAILLLTNHKMVDPH